MPEIETTDTGIILWKNKNDAPADSFKFKDVTIQWGISKDNKLRIRSMHYPTSEYTMDEVLKIAEETRDCTHCKEGHAVKFFNQRLVNKDQGQFHTVKKNMQSMSNLFENLKLPQIPIDSITNFVDPYVGEGISSTLLPALYAQLAKGIFSLSGTNLGKKALGLGIGVGGLLANYFLADQLGLAPRLENELNGLYSNLAASVFDINPEAGFAVDQDLAKLKNALQFGDPNALMSAFFDPSKFNFSGNGNQWMSDLQNNVQKMLNFSGAPNMLGNMGRFAIQPLKPTEEIKIPTNPTVGTYGVGGRWS